MWGFLFDFCFRIVQSNLQTWNDIMECLIYIHIYIYIYIHTYIHIYISQKVKFTLVNIQFDYSITVSGTDLEI